MEEFSSWNSYTIDQARKKMIRDGYNINSSRELLALTCLASQKYIIKDVTRVDSFKNVWKENNRLLEDEYEEYISYIAQSYLFHTDTLLTRPYERINISYEYIMSKLDLFIENLNPEWYQLFYDLFKQRKDVIKLSDDTTKTLYFPASDFWLANIQKRHTIEDFANVAQAYGEGMAEKMRRENDEVDDEVILIQAFAKTITQLFMASLDDFSLQNEITNYFDKEYNDFIIKQKRVYDKYILNALMREPKSAKQVANKIRETLNIDVKDEDIENAYLYSVRKDIQDTIANIIMRELLNIFSRDKDEFIETMNKVVNSQEKPISVLKKLDLEFNTY